VSPRQRKRKKKSKVKTQKYYDDTYPSPIFNGEGNASALDSLGLTDANGGFDLDRQGKTNYEIGVILSAARKICKQVQPIFGEAKRENRTPRCNRLRNART